MTRDAADIARGLAPTRPARPIQAGERIHVIGVGGAAASGAALLAARAGAVVDACDSAGPSPYDEAVVAAGIPVAWHNDPAHVRIGGRPSVDRVAVTKAITSVAPDHDEVKAAREVGLAPESVQQVIADAAATLGRRLIGVTGTHGKSTTTGWLLHQLVQAGRDPSGFVGALLPPTLTGQPVPATVRVGSGPDVVVEADEYAGNFDPYRPAIGAVVSLEWDHPDVFADEDAVLDVVEGWVRRFDGAGEPPILVANATDPGVRRLLDRLHDWSGRVVAVRLSGDGRAAQNDRVFSTAAGPARTLEASIGASDADGTDLLVEGRPARVPLVGAHLAADGLVAMAAAIAAGVGLDAAIESLGTFHGVGRRLELKGDVGGVVVLDDYGHHPTAIAATLAATRQRYPGRRVWAVYEPLTFHRTAAMLQQFADVLATADRVAIVDIWAVRDLDTTIVSAGDLAAATGARGTSAIATGSPEQSAERLAELVEPGDVVLVMGGGRSYVVAERLVALLSSEGGQDEPAATSGSSGSSAEAPSSAEMGTA